MHIIECYAENFGKLHKYTYKASPGLNVICEGNGSGKTTLAVFIRAMFYGMSATRTKKVLDEAERRKHKPWQGGTWGGYLCFEAEGKRYRIERTFADRDSQDTFRLLDMDTGLISEDYTRNIGEELFGIDKAGFGASLYISHNHLQVTLNDSISARIGDTPLDSDDLNNYEKAMKLLSAEYRKYSKNGKPVTIQELQQNRMLYQQKKEQYDSLALVTQPPDITSYPQWKLSASELERLEQLDDFFAGGKPSKGQICKCSELISQCRKDERSIADSRKHNVADDIAIENIALKGFKYKYRFLLYGFAIMAILCGLVMALMPKYIILSSVLCVFFIAGILRTIYVINTTCRVSRKETIDDEYCDSKNKKTNYNVIFLRQLDNIKKIREFLNEYGLLDEEICSDNIELIDLFSDKLTKLNRFIMEYEHLSEKDNDYRKAIEQLQQKECHYAEDAVRRDRQRLSEELHHIELKNAQLESQYRMAQRQMHIIEETKALLEQAHNEMMAGYLSGIRQYFKKYMNLFDSQLSDNINLDITFNVGIDESGVVREMDYYSQGYKDLIRLCQRLALADSLFQNEKPFIILDDPFTNLDDEMLGRAKQALERLGKNMQVLYFTCSWTREPEE